MNGNVFIIIGLVATVVATFCLPYGFHLKSREDSNSQAEYIRSFFDSNNRKLDNFHDVVVLDDDIIDAQRGYMRIKVRKDYLNKSFKTPVTLQYLHDQYQPVMLTFKAHEKYGAGVIFVSPERDNKAEIFLNQCFRFEGFGRMYYSEDLIFEFYYSDYCIYFVTNSAEIRFERQLPPIRYGKNLCIGYFDQSNSDRNKHASEDFLRLESFFIKRLQDRRRETGTEVAPRGK